MRCVEGGTESTVGSARFVRPEANVYQCMLSKLCTESHPIGYQPNIDLSRRIPCTAIATCYVAVGWPAGHVVWGSHLRSSLGDSFLVGRR
jgi:hypothetical protein